MDVKEMAKLYTIFRKCAEVALKCVTLLLVILERRTRTSVAIILSRKIKTVGKISLEKFDLFYFRPRET